MDLFGTENDGNHYASKANTVKHTQIDLKLLYPLPS